MECFLAECDADPVIQIMASDGSSLLHEWYCCDKHAQMAWERCLSQLIFRTPCPRLDDAYVPAYLEMMHVDRRRDTQYAFLCESGGSRRFSWNLGYAEAIHLYNRIKYGVMSGRQTYDFIHRLTSALGGDIARIVVEGKDEQGLFQAVVQIAQSERIVNVDCRPSDALIMSIVCNLPLLVREDLLPKKPK